MSSTSRRRFLAVSSAAVAASSFPAPFLRAQGKTAPAFHGAVVGHGLFRYRVDKLWCQASPETHPVKDCHEMVQAADDRLFLLTNHSKNNILVFEPSGKLVDSWTLNLPAAHGLTLHKSRAGQESLWITDNGGRVLQTSLEGKILLELPTPGQIGAYQPHEPYSPTETAVAPNGDIYVADGYGSQFILRFDSTGQFVGKFGGRSTQPSNPGKFMQAHGIALDLRGPAPLLVCTERIRNEFNWFTLEGKHVRGVYLPGAYVSRPVIHGQHLYSGVCFGAKPDDYRMWQQRGFVTILDSKDQVVSNPGGQPPSYREGRLQLLLQDQPVFENCHDVCVDKTGDLYVCQWNSGKVYPYKLHRETGELGGRDERDSTRKNL
jgi:peptidylamidoglycolate lyase